MNPRPERRKRLNPYLKYSALAIQMAAAIGLAAWIGYRLDARAGTSPVFVLLLVLAAFSGFLFQLWRDLNKDQ